MVNDAASSLPDPGATSHEVLAHLQSGKCTTKALISEYLNFLETTGKRLGAVVEVFSQSALQEAEASDARRMAGETLGVLEGIPFTAKMNICTEEGTTDASSAMLAGFEAGVDATVVQKMRSAGAILVGKSSCDEFAMGASNESSAHGVVRNPWDESRVPGGSSGGAAALAGAFGWAIHLGSDTGGSIRQPAAFCSATGMKPTWGRVSRRGLIAFGSSLDQIGPLARDAKDCQIALEVLQGSAPLDATSLSFSESSKEPIRKIGWIRQGFGEGIDASIREQVEAARSILEKDGIEFVEVSLPTMAQANACYQVIATAEASSNLARYDGIHVGKRLSSNDLEELYSSSRSSGFGAEVRRRILLGTFVLSSGYIDAYYGRAQSVRQEIREEILSALDDVDALMMPVSPFAPFKIGERIDDPLALYACDILTVTANLAGVPAVAVPCAFDNEGLPVGMQWLGKHGDDHRLLQLASLWQELNDTWKSVPQGGQS